MYVCVQRRINKNMYKNSFYRSINIVKIDIFFTCCICEIFQVNQLTVNNQTRSTVYTTLHRI